MDNQVIANSIGIGGAIFVGLVLFWFISVYLKKRMGPEQSNHGVLTSKKISWEEKRQHPRMATSWQASIERTGGIDRAQVKDISLGGAFVVCQQPLPAKEKFTITIEVPNRGPLSLNAEVVWSNVNVPEEKIVNRGMGIRFIENTAEVRQQLNVAITASFENS